MITFENIKITFGDFVAVPDFNLTINKGEFFTLLGPSGCGKTTVLRALAGLNEPAAGRILIGDRDVTQLPSDKRDVGMVFQNYALFPSMTVAENISFGLKVTKVARDERQQRVREIAREVELTEEQLGKNVAALSGGQQQRVAIARALIMRPKILLLDEPLSNLDAKLRAQLRVQLKEMQEHFGITSVYVTHDQEEALTMSDRIAVLNAGRIEQYGTPREIYSASKTEFVCNFIGDANLVPADLAGRKDGTSYVRVEQVALRVPGTAAPAGHLGTIGEVVGHRYQGTTTVYLVRLDEGPVLRALVKEDGASAYQLGDRVGVSFPTDAVLTYERESAR